MYPAKTTEISGWLDNNNIEYELNADLSKKTWIKNGGIADLFITPGTLAQLEDLLLFMIKMSEKYILVGHTSNMFFANSYNPAIIISTKKINKFTIEKNKIICECGASLSKVAKECVKRGIAGYQGLAGIPGTVGAAVCNNSGAYECEMSRIVDRAEILLQNGEKVWLSNSDLELSHRDSILKKGVIKGCILHIELSARSREKPQVLQSMVEANNAYRREYYESYDRNLGSVFSSMDIYSGRKSLRAILKIHRIITGFMPFLVQSKSRNFLVLSYFNKLNLYPYISKKRLNCFIWDKRKNYEDKIFYEYINFIKSKSSKKAVLELQVIDESFDLNGE